MRHKLDGVFCYQDYTALGVIVELLQRRMRVPDDVAVVGFDNLPLGEEFGIPLTTYDYPAETMADSAVQLMKYRILNRPTRSPVKVLVPGNLIVRESTQRQ